MTKSLRGSLLVRSRATAILLVLVAPAACADLSEPSDEAVGTEEAALNDKSRTTTIENDKPIKNTDGHAATFSTMGALDLTNEFHTPQGTNGRSCGSCHLPT